MKHNLHYRFLDKLKMLPFIEEIWLFGSRARGEHAERSDIDLAILCSKAIASDWSKVKDIIEDADTLSKIDYLKFDKHDMGDKFYHNVLTDKEVIYVKNTIGRVF